MTVAFSGQSFTHLKIKIKIHYNDKAEDKAVDFPGIGFLENTAQCSSSCGDTFCRHLLPDILVLLAPFRLQTPAGVSTEVGPDCSEGTSINCWLPALYPHQPTQAFGGFPNNLRDFFFIKKTTFSFSETTKQV